MTTDRLPLPYDLAKDSPVDFAKFCWLLGHQRRQGITSLDKAALGIFGSHAVRVLSATKAAVEAVGTTDAGFTDSYSWRGIAGPIVSLVNRRTVLGRLAPQMRRVPFRVPILTESAPATASWVGDGLAKPLSAFTLDSVQLTPSKIVSIVVFTRELFRTLLPGAIKSVEDNFAASLAKFADAALLDPTAAAVSGTSPGSLTNGLTAIASTGSTAAQISTDLTGALERMINTGSDLSGVSLIVHPTTALYLSAVLTTGGIRAFPEMGATGGEIWSIPVLTSLACGDWGSPTERQIVAVDASRILLADDGKLVVDATEQASLQMVTDPSSGAAAEVSLWQNNLHAFRCERFVAWARADDDGVQVISGVTY